jgi:hypothetical protein
MLSHSGLSKVSYALEEGFFADQVVKSLGREAPVNSERKTLLKEIEEYVTRIENGRSQVTTGKLGDHAIASNAAYRRMLRFVISTTPTTKDRQVIEKLTQEIGNEVKGALESGKIDPKKLQTTTRFFEFVQEATLRESALTLGWESAELTRPVGVP